MLLEVTRIVIDSKLSEYNTKPENMENSENISLGRRGRGVEFVIACVNNN